LDRDRASKRFYDLVWPHRQAVLRTAQILVGSTADAEDLTQETLLKAFKAIEQFRPGTDARAWLMTILRNTRIDRARATRSEENTVSLDGLSVELAASPETEHETGFAENAEELLERFSDEQIIAAMKLLPEEIRWTLLLVDVEGIEQQHAASILNVPLGTIKSRAHRGRSMLRQALLPLAQERRLVQ
jgi:RNA polymerase sigma-70 factor (ECF subfamily)